MTDSRNARILVAAFVLFLQCGCASMRKQDSAEFHALVEPASFVKTEPENETIWKLKDATGKAVFVTTGVATLIVVGYLRIRSIIRNED